MTAQQAFAACLRSHLVPALRSCGYAGSGQHFHRRFGRNWAAVNVQRDKWSDAQEVRFTVNLGTKSALVLEEEGADAESPVREVMCDWRARIGTVMPSQRDTWWSVRSGMSEAEASRVGAEVADALLRYGLPAVERMASDSEIARSALERARPRPPATLDILAPILRAIGPRDIYDEVLSDIDALGDRAVSRFVRERFTSRAMSDRQVTRFLKDLGSTDQGRRAWAASELGWAAPSERVIAALRRALDDAAAVVRGFAAQGLGRLSDGASSARLIDMLRSERSPHAAVGAAIGLAHLATTTRPELRDPVMDLLHQRHETASGSHRAAFHVLEQRLGNA
jgi:hypothetical protein